MKNSAPTDLYHSSTLQKPPTTEVKITIETTPDPESLKFQLSVKILTIGHQYSHLDETEFSPLAHKLFGFPWMQSVFLGENFITITKQSWISWDFLREPLCQIIAEHLLANEPIVLNKKDFINSDEDEIISCEDEINSDDDEIYSIKRPNGSNGEGLGVRSNPPSEKKLKDSIVIRRIKQILNHHFRPYVQMDGGDLQFSRFEDGVLYLHMQGACSGCPSKKKTLKDVLEVRFKELIPEIREVRSL